MQLSDHLLPENVAIDLAFRSKKDLLSKLAELGAEKTGIPKDVIAKALDAREGLGSTGIGHGVAIPHAILDTLDHSCCIVLRLSRPLDFEAVDDVPVDVIVLLLSPPAEQGQYVEALSLLRGW